jgi:hypothetical protein
MEDGQVLVRDFEDIHDFMVCDYLLHKQAKLSYEFYYGGQHIERLEPAERENEVGFPEESEYLEAIVKMIDNCKMFQ